MADLIPAPSPYGEMPLDTSRAPQPRVSGGAIAASYGEEARGMEKLGSGVMDLATPIAEAQAASDLQNQKVTLGPDGKVQVMNPARSLIFGRAGEAYGQTVAQSTAAQVGNLVDQQLTDIHAKYYNDPDGQAKANTTFLAGLKGVTGNPVIDNAIMVRANERANQHFDSNVMSSASLERQRNYTNDAEIVRDREEKLFDLAQHGVGAGDKTYDQATQERSDALARLQASAIGKTSPEVAAHKERQFQLGLQSEATLGGLHDLITNHGGIPAAKIALDRIKDDPEMDPSIKRQILSQGAAIVQSEQGAWESQVKQSRDAGDDFVKAIGLHKPEVTPSSPALRIFYDNAIRLGDIDSVKAIDGAWATYYHMKPGEALPEDIRRQIYDLPGKTTAPAPSGVTPKGAEVTVAPLPPATGAAPKAGDMSPQGGPYVSSGGKIYPTDKSGKIIDQPAAQPAPAATTAAAAPKAEPAVATAGETPKAEPAAVTTGASEGAAGAHGAFIGALVKAESNGQNIYSRTDPDVSGPNTRSQGYAQINTPTWLDFAAKAGVDTKKYANAMSAPYDVQIQVASVIPVTRFGPRTRAILHAQFGQFDDHTTVGELDARYGGSSRAPSDAGGGGAPSANGVPFTAEQVRQNPYLMSTYIHAIASDPEEKVGTLSAMVEGFGKIAQYSDTLPIQDVAAVKQFYDSNPNDVRAQKLWGETQGIMAAMTAPGGGPAAAQFKADVEKLAHDSPDIMHGYMAEAFKTHEEARAKQRAEEPYTFAANREIIKPIAPIDPSNLAQIGPILAARADAGRVIASASKDAAPPLLQKSDGPILNAAIGSPDGTKALLSINASLKDEDLRVFSNEKEAHDALIGAWHSGDPAKMAAAFAVLKRLEDHDSLDFHAKFPEKDIAQMEAWNRGLNNADAPTLKKQIERQSDPNVEKMEAPLREQAHKMMVDGGYDINKVARLIGQPGTFFRTGAEEGQPPAPAGLDDPANVIMYSEFQHAFETGVVQGLDASGAEAYAVKAVSAKYGKSQINGGRTMAYPPESFLRNQDGSPATVNGTFDYANGQIDDDIKKTLGIPAAITRGATNVGGNYAGGEPNEIEGEHLRMFNGPRVLIGDDTTHSDYVAGKPPSYQIYLQRSNGTWQPLMDASGTPQRIRIDPKLAQADQINKSKAGGSSLMSSVREMLGF